MSKKIKSPEQVKRIDGRGCFMELLTIGLPRDKIALNFVAYNTAANKGDRVSGSILVYMEIHKAEVFANNVLDGTMTKLGNQSKKYAADHGYKYAKDVFCDLTGTPTDRSTRADKQPISRQLKLTPGSKTAWVLSAESGPGKMEGPGLIAPAYSGGRPECVIRIPLSDDDLKALALSIQAMCRMWYTMKFVPDVEVVDPKTPVFAVQNPDKRLELHTGALAMQKQQFISRHFEQSFANNILDFKTAKVSGVCGMVTVVSHAENHTLWHRDFLFYASDIRLHQIGLIQCLTIPPSLSIMDRNSISGQTNDPLCIVIVSPITGNHHNISMVNVLCSPKNNNIVDMICWLHAAGGDIHKFKMGIEEQQGQYHGCCPHTHSAYIKLFLRQFHKNTFSHITGAPIWLVGPKWHLLIFHTIII